MTCPPVGRAATVTEDGQGGGGAGRGLTTESLRTPMVLAVMVVIDRGDGVSSRSEEKGLQW